MIRKRSEELELQERRLLQEEAEARKAEEMKKMQNEKESEFVQSNFTDFHEPPPKISVHSGKVGSSGFVDGVLSSEARFACPSGIAILDDAILVSDTGKMHYTLSSLNSI